MLLQLSQSNKCYQQLGCEYPTEPRQIHCYYRPHKVRLKGRCNRTYPGPKGASRVGANHAKGCESVHPGPRRATGKHPSGCHRCNPVRHSLIALRTK